jgi:hypothetical protein
MRIFDDLSLAALAGLYPEQPGLIPHGLAGHDLLTPESLAKLARRIRAVDVEYNRGDLPVGLDPADVPANGLEVEETIRTIETNGSWMVLKFVEQDPEYRAFLHDILAELEPVVAVATGAMLKLQGFIFLSSPGSVTPFHFDPEHNILLQVRGTKRMIVFPAGDESIAHGAHHEAFHAGGHRNLPYDERFASRGEAFDLVPGRGIYVPVKAPHWVQNGPGTSISLSITWRSQWSYDEEYAHGFNRLVRRIGVRPRMTRRHPRGNRLKSIGYRAAMKLGKLIR